MFVILEGENKTGKSSLAKHIQKMTGWEIIKFSQPKKEDYVEYVEFLLNRKEPAILDRFHVGAQVYGPVWRKKVGLNEWQFRMIEMLLMARNSLNIYCETDEETIKENFVKEKEELAKVEQVHDILLHFRQTIKSSYLDWFKFDYQYDGNYSNFNHRFVEWLAIWQQNEAYLKLLIETRAIGNPFAKNVIVGEICNGDLELEKYKHIILPFAKGVSSDYLWKAIDSIPKTQYLMTNIKKYHHNSRVDSRDVFIPNAKKIICLGNNSWNAVTDSVKGTLQFYKIAKAKHPAWGTRFNVEPEKYAKDIIKELV